MKRLTVKLISAGSVEPQQVHALLDNAGVEYHDIDTVNWQEYPYRPQVRFRIAHTGGTILLEYSVCEKTSRARYGEDDGSVWTDSCVEFFSCMGGDNIYYNIETNCIGTVLLGAGPEREGRFRAGRDITSKIKRYSTLGDKPFEEKETGEWSLSLVIPAEVFHQHDIRQLGGRTVRANFYKCGDELSTPHFLSWNPIEIEKPDFHRPDFFGEITFE